jgi:hypothetical protein
VTAYDVNILQQYADSLYREAQMIVLWTAAGFGFGAFVISVVIVMVIIALGPQIGINSGEIANAEMIAVLLITVLTTLAGVALGRKKAFQLKLQAQQILCQRQIEINTRNLPTQEHGARPLL